MTTILQLNPLPFYLARTAEISKQFFIPIRLTVSKSFGRGEGVLMVQTLSAALEGPDQRSFSASSRSGGFTYRVSNYMLGVPCRSGRFEVILVFHHQIRPWKLHRNFLLQSFSNLTMVKNGKGKIKGEMYIRDIQTQNDYKIAVNSPEFKQKWNSLKSVNRKNNIFVYMF